MLKELGILLLFNIVFLNSFMSSTALVRAPHASRPQVRFKILISLAAAFWMFVTLTNILYGYSMQVNADKMVNAVLYAPWYTRALQHILLFPLLVGCFAASLRTGWVPLRRLPVQLLFGVIFASLSFYAMVAAEMIFWSMSMPSALDTHEEAVGALWTGSFVMFFMTYCFGIVLVTGFAYYQRLRDAEVRNGTLEQGWSKARLSALRMQLSPHTLFNLLHTIRGHINQEPQLARAMVVQLADLLRRLLSASQREFAPLADELVFVKLYLELQQQRFSDRLTVVLPPSDRYADLWIPSLILQPLVENAVLHGLAGDETPVTVRVEVCVTEQTVILRVINTMTAQYTGAPDGIGLSNVRERLAVQFGAEASFSAGPNPLHEWLAELTLPVVRELPPASAVPLVEA